MHSITRHQKKLISTLISSGRFANKSEVVRAGLRLLEEHERQLESSKPTMGAGKKSAEQYPLARSKQTPAKDAARVLVEGEKGSKR